MTKNQLYFLHSHEFVLTPRFKSAQALEMSTEALADYAAHLDAFKEAKGGLEFYRERAKNDPALAELEKRTDAGDWIAVITDKNPELKSSEFLKSVFPQVERFIPPTKTIYSPRLASKRLRRAFSGW